MLPDNNRAFKEWAVVCDALKSGDQTVLIRKGGIREEGGVFRVSDQEFFLLPTYEHQCAALLNEEAAARFEESASSQVINKTHPTHAHVDAYAVIDSVTVVPSDDAAYALGEEHIWNHSYIRTRLDFNPYDPLYVLQLRVYRLPEALAIPLRPEYGGCMSWVTLVQPLSTLGAIPALSDTEFERRRAHVHSALRSVERA